MVGVGAALLRAVTARRSATEGLKNMMIVANGDCFATKDLEKSNEDD
jgi:hypothetical protein